VAPVRMTFPDHDEGAPGPSLLGTGEGDCTFPDERTAHAASDIGCRAVAVGIRLGKFPFSQ